MSSHPQTIHLNPYAVSMVSGGLMSFAGLIFSSVAFASGIRAFDLLTLLFMLGAAGALLALIMFYLINLRTQ